MKSMIFFVGICLIMSVGCRRFCTPTKYSCSGGVVNIYPSADSIQAGDTLWFNAVIPTKVKYQQGNNSDSLNYDLSGASNVMTDFHLTTPSGINTLNGAIDSFSFSQVKGILKSNPLIPNAGKTIIYDEYNGVYTVTFYMIAKKKGIYFLSIIDIYEARKKCDKISVTNIMNNLDGHLHYLRDTYYGGGDVSSIESTHTYCFKVY